MAVYITTKNAFVIKKKRKAFLFCRAAPGYAGSAVHSEGIS